MVDSKKFLKYHGLPNYIKKIIYSPSLINHGHKGGKILEISWLT